MPAETVKNAVAMLPTYLAQRWENAGLSDTKIEGVDFGPPDVPVSIHEAEGLAIVLGSQVDDHDKPNVQIERRPHGWAIFLHPVGGGDAAGVVYFHDDGRSFFAHECSEDVLSGTPRLQIIDGPACIPDLDS